MKQQVTEQQAQDTLSQQQKPQPQEKQAASEKKVTNPIVEELTKSQAELKNYTIQKYCKQGIYLDVLDTRSQWCVGRVQNINDKGYLEILFDGWSEKFKEVHHQNSRKIDSFRKWTQPYTGAPKQTIREDYQLEKMKVEAPQLIEEMGIMEDNFKIENVLTFIQQMRGSLYFFGDTLLSTSKQIPEKDVSLYVEFFLAYIRLFVKFIKILPTVLPHYIEAMNQNKSLFLVHPKVALASSYSELFTLIYCLFGGDSLRCSKFYKVNRCEFTQHADPFVIKSKEGTTNQEQMLNFMNYFGTLYGFDNLLDLISWEQRNSSDVIQYQTPIPIVKKIVDIFEKCILFMPKKKGFSYYQNIKMRVFERLSKTTEKEMKDVDLNQLKLTIKSIIDIHKKQTGESLICEEAEKLEVRFIIRLIKCSFLEKKILGVFQFKDIIQRANSASPTKQQFFKTTDTNAFEYLTRAKLKQFLEEENLLDYLLGENFHSEVFIRSLDLLTFLSEENALQSKHLDMIWRLTENKHEADLAAIYSVIIDLAKILPEKSLDQLFKNINTLPFELYSDLTINLLQNFTLNASQSLNPSSYFSKGSKVECAKSKEFEHYGLSKLWQAIQDQNKLPNQLTQSCVIALREILSAQLFQSQREKYIQFCLENLKNGQSVPQSLELAIYLLKTFTPTSSFMSVGETTREGLIMKFNKDIPLIDAIVKDFENYQKQLLSKLKKYGVTIDEKQGEEAFIGKYGHTQNIDIRLEFVSLVNKHLQSKGKTITIDQLKKLWKILVKSNVTSLEKQKFLSWIIKKKMSTNEKQTNPGSVLDEELLSQSLSEIFGDQEMMNGYQIDLDIFECFKSIFLSVNLKNKSMEINVQKLIFVSKFDLMIGKDILWQLSLFCFDLKVLEEVRNLLVSIHLRKTYKSTESLIKMWQKFQDKCQEVLVKATIPQVQAHIVIAIKQFLQEMEGKMYFGEKRSDMQILITTSSSNSFKKVLKIDSNSSLLRLRKEISKELKLVNKDFDMVLTNKNIHISKSQEEEYSVEALQVNDGKLPNIQITQIKENNQDQIEIDTFKKVVANSSFSESLFSYLSNGQNELIVDNAWEVLNILPKNPNVVKKLKSIELDVNSPLNWEDFLPPNCYRKLQYCQLIITEQFLGKNGQKDDQWCKQLIKRGGLRHMLSIFFDTDVQGIFEKPFNLYYLSTLAEIISKLIEEYYDTSKKEFRTQQQKGDNILEQILVKTIEYIIQALDSTQLHSASNQQYLIAFFKNSFELLSQVIAQDSSLIQSHLSNESSQIQLVLHGLLHLKDEEVCKQLQMSLLKVINMDQSNQTHLAFQNTLSQILKKEQDNLSTTYRQNSLEFFVLYRQLLTHIHNKGLVNSTFLSANDLISTLKIFINLIKTSSVFEQTRHDSDGMLRGAFECAQQLISMDSQLSEIVITDEKLIKGVVNECLFAFSSEDSNISPKCKSSKCRQSAFSFLVAIQSEIIAEQQKKEGAFSQIQDVNSLINEFFKSAHWRSKSKGDWNIREEQEKEGNWPIGLKNLGCTCYMNSLVQQLFMIKDFSEALLKVDASTSQQEFNQKENVLFQLQGIFGALGLSQRQCYDPREFCHAFKDLEGQPINVMQQMDVDEFFSTLMDRVEELLKPSKNEFIIKDVFEGKLSNELIGRGGGCNHVSEREESFLAVNLPVKSKKNLQECLASFVQGEMLDGDNSFFCEKCDKKVPTLKRQSLKKLPNQLLIVLKRFHFDLETMQKIKINSYCEFPEKLDIRQYTTGELKQKDQQKENGELSTQQSSQDNGNSNSNNNAEDSLPDEYFQYKLRGIVIHQGTSESGHYYSLIRQTDGKWLEFNDTIVRQFDYADLPSEAYGGEQEETNGNSSYGQPWMNMASSKMANAKNAYLLFYERENFFDQNGKRKDSIIDHSLISNPLNVVKENILRENKKLHLNKYLFSSDIQDYSNNLLKSINVEKQTEYSNKVCAFLIRYYFFCMQRQFDKQSLLLFRKKLGEILSANYLLSSWLVRNFANEMFVKEIFLDCHIDNMKYLSAGIIIDALNTVCRYEQEDSYDFFVKNSSVVPLVNIGIYIIATSTGIEAKQMDQFHRIICRAGEASLNARKYLLKQKMVGRLQSSFIEIKMIGTGYQDFNNYKMNNGESEFELQLPQEAEEKQTIKILSIDEFLEQKEKTKRIGTIKKNLQYLFKLHSLLLRSSQPNPQIKIPGDLTLLVQPPIDHILDKDEIDTFRLSSYFTRLIPYTSKKMTRNYIAMSQAYLTTENEQLMNEYVSNWTKAVNDSKNKLDQNDLKPYFVFFKHFIQLNDSLANKRAVIAAQKMSNFMIENFKFFYAASLGASAIIKLAQISKAFSDQIKNEMNTNKEFLSALDYFLQAQSNLPMFLNNRNISLFRDQSKMQQINGQYLQQVASVLKKHSSSRRGLIAQIQQTGQLGALDYDSDEDYSERIVKVNEKVDLRQDQEFQTCIVTDTFTDLFQIQKEGEKQTILIKFDDEMIVAPVKAAKYYIHSVDQLHYDMR